MNIHNIHNIHNIYNNLLFLDALAALKEIQKRNPEAIIAGGFLRDLFFGIQPKDLDIFVNQLGNYGGNFIITKDYDMSYSTDNEIAGVQNMYHTGSPATLDINVIEVTSDNIRQRVETHDFDFCKCYTDGVNIYNLEVLENVKSSGIVHLAACENQKQFDRSMRRWERFSKKMPQLVLSLSFHDMLNFSQDPTVD